MYSASRGGGGVGGRLLRRVAAVVLVAAVIGAAWYFWPRTPESASAAEDATSSDALAAATGADDPIGTTALTEDEAADQDRLDALPPGPGASDAEDAPTSGGLAAALPEPEPTEQAPLSFVTMGEPVGDVETPVTADRARPAPPEGVPTEAATSANRPLPGGAPAVTALMTEAQQATAQNDLPAARALLNRAFQDPRATEAQRAAARERIEAVNQTLVFSPAVLERDPLSMRYVVKPGDTLAKITAEQDLKVDWRFIQRINEIADPRRIRVGQTLKLVKGPFHAMIDKSEYRLDLYAQVHPSAETQERPDAGLFIRSFRVGLGEHNSTPPGNWVVRDRSKLVNPPWTNPRTGEYYSADNPENPIGERWIGLRGVDEQTKLMSGYGLHGTIEPETIGSDASMGCVRMMPGSVEVLFEMLVEGESRVRIVE